ncbi:MAG: hypothetical protein HF312_11020 [Ignavibacteria bacterium]|jgi:hypothetical protein|nr:hypothetical protein [Ignavibacteria bacterium]
MSHHFTISKYSSDFWEPFQEHSWAYISIQHYIETHPDREESDIVVITEPSYTDKDYLIDFANYYVRCHENIEKKVKRHHFFYATTDELNDLFSQFYSGDTSKNKRNRLNKLINDKYVGYVIQKPITSGRIGRTVLKRYPDKTKRKHDRCLEVTKVNTVHLNGITLTINSLPFQEQDSAVAACATMAIWTALQALEVIFGVSVSNTPSEVTILAYNNFNGLAVSPKFPNVGLSTYQIVDVFYKLGYEVMNYNVKQLNDKKIQYLLIGYLSQGYPLIATLYIYEEGKEEPEGHAVAITGYCYDKKNDAITKLYVHDDQIGPYSCVEFSEGNFLDWTNEWITERGCKKVKLQGFIIPLYHKIRLSFTSLYTQVIEDIEDACRKEDPYLIIKPYLINSSLYKKSLIDDLVPIIGISKIESILFAELPKYIWVVRVGKGEFPFRDYIIDATTQLCEGYLEVNFVNNESE